MHMLEHNFIHVLEESATLDMFRITVPVRIRLSNSRFRFRANEVRIRRPLARTNYFRLSSRAIYTISDCLLLIDNRGRLILCLSNSINSHRY